MSRDSLLVKELGERFGIAYLQEGKIPVPERSFVGYLSAIGVAATNSQGVFEAIVEGPVGVFILLKGLRWTKSAGNK